MSKVDFSILNDTDIFYVDCIGTWLTIQGLSKEYTNSRTICLRDQDVYRAGRLCERNQVRELRLATKEEVKIFYRFFPEEKHKQAKTKKIVDHLTIKDMQEAGWKFSYTK